MGNNLNEAIEQEIKDQWKFGLGFNVEKYEKLKWDTFKKIATFNYVIELIKKQTVFIRADIKNLESLGF